MSTRKANIELSLSTLIQLITICGLIVGGTLAVANINYRITNVEKEDRRLSSQLTKMQTQEQKRCDDQDEKIKLFARILLKEDNPESQCDEKNRKNNEQL